MEKLVKVECILDSGYNDKELNEFIKKGRIYFIPKDRAEYLEEKNAIKIIEDSTEEIEEIEIEKPRKNKRTSKTN
jgi:hypothetical protein